MWEPSADTWNQAREANWAPECRQREKWGELGAANKQRQRGEREQPERSEGSQPAGTPRAEGILCLRGLE